MKVDRPVFSDGGDPSDEMGLTSELLRSIVGLAREHRLRSLVLFGSRARGDFACKSDIDLAVSGGDFARFCLDVEDEVPTLLGFDFVNLDEAIAPALRKAIEEEGRVLYEEVR